MSEMEVGII